MGHVIVIFGSLIALNLGFGFWLSEENMQSNSQGVVEIEEVSLEQNDKAATNEAVTDQ